MARVWAALLRAGPGAVAGPETSLWLAGALDTAPRVIDVCVPLHRHPDAAGLRVTRRRALSELTHPTLDPPRLRLDVAVLDAVAGMRTPVAVIDLVLRVTQRRLTTAARLRRSLAARRAQRWRRLLDDVLADVEDGVQSALERRYRRDVEQRHGLPSGSRNRAESEAGSRRYRDVRYLEYDMVVELDGREAHPDEEVFRDRTRDNRAAAAGDVSLRYGWREVAGDPCDVAAQVILILRRLGRQGAARGCGPRCAVGRLRRVA